MGKRFWTSAAVAAFFVAACDGSSPPVPTTIIVTPGTVSFATLGETQQFQAELRDENGNVMTGTFTFSWTSSNPNAVTVSASGVATAQGAGQATITASAESVSGSATVDVDQTPDDLRAAEGDGQTGEAGELLGQPITVVVFDAGGSPVQGKPVNFNVVEGGGSVTNPTVTTTTAGRAQTGWTLGATPGVPQRVRASIGSLNVDFTATAEQGILAVKTTSLNDARQTLDYADKVEGKGGDGSFTFSLDAGSLPAGLTLQSSGNIGGTPTTEGTSSFTIRVTDGTGASAIRQLSLRVCPAPLSLGVGQIVEVGNQTLGGCSFFLPSGANGDRYRVTVMWPSESEAGVTVQTTLDMDAEGVQPSAPASAPLVAAQDLGPRVELAPHVLEDIRIAERTEALHREIRRQEAPLIARLKASARASGASSVPLQVARQRVDPPGTVTLNTPTDFGSCSSGSSQPSTLRGFNDFLAIYQANSQMGGAQEVSQENIDRLLDYYDNYGDEVTQKYFGGVSDINGDSRMTVLITPEIDDGTAAFVWSGDFFQKTTGGTGLPGVCPDSNAQEVIYMDADFINSMTPPPGGGGVSYQPVSTMVHEAKHVSSLYNRVTSNAGGDLFNPSFMEEGGAEIAGEMSSRLAWAATGGPAVGAEVTRQDFADAFGGGQPISMEAYGVFLRMARIVYYASARPNGVSGAPPGQQTGIYGSGLAFHRFLGDAYGGAAAAPLGDQSFFQTWNDPATPGGLPGLVTVTGKSYLQLLEEFVLAVMMEGTGFEPQRAFTTYDLSTATEIFSLPDPAGSWPWPITRLCNGTACTSSIDSREGNPDTDDGYQPDSPFTDRSWMGPVGPGGFRIHEFLSNGTGSGAAVTVTGSTALKVYVARIN